MNTDEMKGRWKEFRGKMKQQWGKLTDDELDRVEGKWDELTGLVQQRYGKMRDEAEREVRTFRESTERAAADVRRSSDYSDANPA